MRSTAGGGARSPRPAGAESRLARPHSGRLRLPSCSARQRRGHARRATATRPVPRCALHAGCRCSPSGFARQRPVGGVWRRVSGTALFLYRFALLSRVNSFPIADPDGADEWGIGCFTAQISASFRSFRRFLRIPQRLRSWFDPRRLPSAAACQLSAPLCGGGRGAGPRAAGAGQEPRAEPRAGAQGRSRGQVRRAKPRTALLPPGGSAPSFGLAPCSEGCGSRVGPGAARPGEWERLGVPPSPGPRGVGPPYPGCRALSPGRPLWDLGGGLLLAAPGAYRGHLPAGWGGLPSPPVGSARFVLFRLSGPALDGRQSMVWLRAFLVLVERDKGMPFENADCGLFIY
ncbi:unnamed protein product [Coccothraustes coccothraustes]